MPPGQQEAGDAATNPEAKPSAASLPGEPGTQRGGGESLSAEQPSNKFDTKDWLEKDADS